VATLAQVFFTSDLHFGHENVLGFDKRPFTTLEEMENELIQRWNVKVSKEDTVYVLGDMIWKSRNGDAHKLIKSLNGQIILIKGNHDRFLLNAKAKNALVEIKDYDDIRITLQDGTVHRCILCHYFIPMYNGHRHGAIHLHGHSHFSAEADYELLMAKELNDAGITNEIYNVGCMHWNYEPVTLDEILKNKRGNIYEK
jgi:calcineurin-like phosphoesterase family protein